jgi:hypothetical protein
MYLAYQYMNCHSQAPGGRQQPPPGGNPRQANHRPPPEDLRQHINEGHDARSVIDSRRKVREEVETEGTDYSDHFVAFSARFSSYKYPEGFKPIGITKYDGKQAPQQWLCCYSTAIEVAGGSNITKVVYFLMALDPAPLTWLESLSNNSIDSWERLKKVFIDNFQGAIARAGTRHDLAQCKQECNELLRSYTHRFFDVRATIANISEEDIIDYFYNGITDPSIYRDFGRNRPKIVAGLRDMMHDWSEQEEKMREWFPRRQDSNLRHPNDNHNDKSQRDYSGLSRKRKPDDLIVAVDHPSRGKKSTMQEEFEKLLQKKCPWHPGANHAAIDCYYLRRIFSNSGGGKKNKKPVDKEPEDDDQGTKGATRSSRMLQKLSMSSSGEMETSAPDGTINCFSGRSCPSSRRYHDHFIGRRSPSCSLAMTGGQASRSPVSSPWSWIQWWQKSGSPRCSSTVGVVSISSSPAL